MWKISNISCKSNEEASASDSKNSCELDYPTDDGTTAENIVLNTTVQETNRVRNSLSGLSEMDDIKNDSRKSVKEQEMLINDETFLQNQNRTYPCPSCGASKSSIKHLEQDGVENLEKQNSDIENTKNCEESSSDAILIKRNRIKKRSVSPIRAKPFAVHYSRSFVKKIALDAYKLFQKTKVLNFNRFYRKLKISKFSTLKKEKFIRKIKKYIRYFYYHEQFMIERFALLKKKETQLALTKNKKKQIVYHIQSVDDFIIVDKEDVQVHEALQKKKFAVVKLERNKEAEFLAKKLMESNSIKQNKLVNVRSRRLQPVNCNMWQWDHFVRVCKRS